MARHAFQDFAQGLLPDVAKRVRCEIARRNVAVCPEMHLHHGRGAALGHAGIRNAGEHGLVHDARVVGFLPVTLPELNDLSGLLVGEQALALLAQAAGGDDVEQEDFEHVQIARQIHHRIQFADQYLLPGGVSRDPGEQAGLAAEFQAACRLGKQAGPAAEQSTLQKIVATLAFMSLVGTFILGGLDHRFGWSAMPLFVIWGGDVLVVVSFFLYNLVFKANSFGASNIRVEENQRVSSTGPYALVRHPMYSVGVLLFVAIALGLGSWWTLLLIVVAIPVLVLRILDEEKVLEKELAGYSEYEQKVHYRILPYLW